MDIIVKRYKIICFIIAIVLLLFDNILLDDNDSNRLCIIFHSILSMLYSSMIVSIMVVIINECIVTIRKKYYLGLEDDYPIYLIVDIHKLSFSISLPIRNLLITHSRITSGDDIIALSFLEAFLNVIDVKYKIVDSDIEFINKNIASVGMSSIIFNRMCRNFNICIPMREGERVLIRNIKSKKSIYRDVNLDSNNNYCYIMKMHNEDKMILSVAGQNEISTLEGSKFLANKYKDINKCIPLLMKIFYIISIMCGKKYDILMIIRVRKDSDSSELAGIWWKNGRVLEELYNNHLY